MGKYKSFVQMDRPKKFDYDNEKLESNGYKFRGRFNKNNIEFLKYCDDLKLEGKTLKIIELKSEDSKVDL